MPRGNHQRAWRLRFSIWPRCHGEWGSPAASRPRSLASPRSVRRSWAEMSSRRARYRGVVLCGPGGPRCRSGLRRRTSSMLLLARRITWNGSATPAGVGRRHVEGAPVRPGEVQHAPVDALAPRLGLCEQPPGGTRSVATTDKVEQLTLGHVHDGGAPPAGAPGAVASEQGLIETERLHRADPCGVGGEQRFAPGRAPPGSPCASHSPTRRPHRRPGGRRGPPPSSPSVPPAP